MPDVWHPTRHPSPVPCLWRLLVWRCVRALLCLFVRLGLSCVLLALFAVAGDACCKADGAGECTRHADTCGAGSGVFLLFKSSSVRESPSLPSLCLC